MTARLLNCSVAEYHADPCKVASLSSSIAKILLEQSPLHARLAHPRLNPHYAPEEKEDFDFGAAAHAMLLERTSNNIVWCEFNDWRKNAAKEARAAARKSGKLPILVHYQQVLAAMVAKAHEFIRDSELAGILDSGTAEQAIVWQEGPTYCRARLDLLSVGHDVVLDYKSTENAQPDMFIRQIGRMSYDLQAEFYTRGMKAINGKEPRFVFLVQEKTAPFACSLVALSNAYRAVGIGKVQAAIQLWGQCMSTQSWPGYSTQIHYAEPSPWQLLPGETL